MYFVNRRVDFYGWGQCRAVWAPCVSSVFSLEGIEYDINLTSGGVNKNIMGVGEKNQHI